MTDLADEPRSLLDWVTGLATDPALRARFADEPRSVLDEQGLTGLRPADLHHALPLVSDSVAARLGADVDTAVFTSTAAQLAGEDPASALARQLGVVTESVLAAGGTAVPGPEVDDDPVHLDDLDDPGPTADPAHDLDGPDHGPDAHHDHDHDLDGPFDHPVATVTVLPVDPSRDADAPVDAHGHAEAHTDAHADGLVVVIPPEDPPAGPADGHVDLLPDADGEDAGLPHHDEPHPDAAYPDDAGPDDAGPDDAGPHDAGVESFV